MKLHYNFLLVFSLTLTACQWNHHGIPSPSSNTSSAQVIPNGQYLRQLQQLLTNRGFPLGRIDGKKGPSTSRAIRAYQRANKLTEDGVANYNLLQQLGGRIPSNLVTQKTQTLDEGNIADRCLNSGSADLDKLASMVFESVIDDLQIDITSYLSGYCIPSDRDKLAKLYVFLVTEGVIHSRLATTYYNQLVTVFEKAGIEIAVDKDGIRRSTEDLRPDIRETAKDRLGGVSVLVSHSFEVDDNAEFQKNLKQAYDKIERNSPYKRQARQLLAKVLTHSSSSTFYLVRSSYTIDKLTSYFGINIGDGISIAERTVLFVKQFTTNYKLAFFLLSQQSNLSDMLIASTYNLRALTQNIKDIPRLNSRQATREVRKLKKEEGLTLNEFEVGFDNDNTPIAIPRDIS